MSSKKEAGKPSRDKFFQMRSDAREADFVLALAKPGNQYV